MLVLHHLDNSRSIRILWLLEEMQLEYELRQHQRDSKSGLAQSDLKQHSTLGKAPMLEDGDRLILESGAIIEYLLDHYGDGSLRPPEKSEQRIHYNYWLHAAEGTYMNVLTLTLFLNRMDSGAPLLFKLFIKPVTNTVRRTYLTPYMQACMTQLEGQLGERTWFAGDAFSAADIQMGFVMTALAARGGLGDDYPNCQRWLKQVQERPGYQRAMAKNGPMELVT